MFYQIINCWFNKSILIKVNFNKYDKNGEKIYYKRIEKGFVVTEWERIFEGEDCVYYKDLVLNKERFYTYEKNGISSKKTIYTDENLGENWRYVNGNLKYNWKTRIIKDTWKTTIKYS